MSVFNRYIHHQRKSTIMKTGLTFCLLLFSIPFFAQLEFTKDMIEVEGSASYRYDDSRSYGTTSVEDQKRIRQSFNIDAGFGWHIKPGIVYGVRFSTNSIINKIRGTGETKSTNHSYGLEFFHRRYLNINNWQRIRFFGQLDLGSLISTAKTSDLIRNNSRIVRFYQPVNLRAGLGIFLKITQRIGVYKYLFGASYSFEFRESETTTNTGIVSNGSRNFNHSIRYSSTQTLTQFSIVYILNVDKS